MNKARVAVGFALASVGGGATGGAVGNLLTPEPNKAEATATVEDLSLQTHGTHMRILETAPEGSCEQHVLHFIISQNHQYEFPESAADLTNNLNEVCGDSGVDHVQIGATAFAGFEEAGSLRDGIIEAQEDAEEKSDKVVNTIGGAAIGSMVAAVGFVIFKTRNFIRYGNK